MPIAVNNWRRVVLGIGDSIFLRSCVRAWRKQN
jgi:hypothetical protein